MQRLMSGPATGDDSDLAGPGSITTDDETVRVVYLQRPGMRGLNATQRISNDSARIVD